jgi:hypothetical protein
VKGERREERDCQEMLSQKENKMLSAGLPGLSGTNCFDHSNKVFSLYIQRQDCGDIIIICFQYYQIRYIDILEVWLEY